MESRHLQVAKENKRTDLHGRILIRAIAKLHADERIPRDVVERLKAVLERREVSPDEIFRAITAEGSEP